MTTRMNLLTSCGQISGSLFSLTLRLSSATFHSAYSSKEGSMAQQQVLSADSHVVEPADVWTTRMDARYRDRAPHIEKEANGIKGDFFVCEGIQPFSVSGFAVPGVDPKDYSTEMVKGYPGVRPGSWDPIQRVKDQEIDGVQGEVLYTSLGMFLYGI